MTVIKVKFSCVIGSIKLLVGKINLKVILGLVRKLVLLNKMVCVIEIHV